MPQTVGVGTAIGEGAQAPDRADLLLQLAQNREQYIEAGKKRAKELEDKQKEAGYNKDKDLLIKQFGTAGIDQVMLPKLTENANKAMEQLYDAYINTRTVQDFDRKATPIILAFSKDYDIAKQNGKNYQVWRNLSDEQIKLLPFDQQLKAHAIQNNPTDIRDITENINGINGKGYDLFPINFNSQTGSVGLPNPTLDKVRSADLITSNVKMNKSDGYAQELLKGITNVDATTYKTLLQYIPITKADADAYAKEKGLPDGTPMPSIEGKADTFINSTAGKILKQSWLQNQFTDAIIDSEGNLIGGEAKTNMDKYFEKSIDPQTGSPMMKNDHETGKPVAETEFKKYVMGEIEQKEVPTVKYISGRPESKTTFGIGGSIDKGAEKIYQESKDNIKSNFNEATHDEAVAKNEYDKAVSKDGANTKTAIAAKAKYDKSVQYTKTFTTERNKLDDIKGAWDKNLTHTGEQFQQFVDDLKKYDKEAGTSQEDKDMIKSLGGSVGDNKQ